MMNEYIDSTNLKVTATKEEIEKLCRDARKYHFASVCVHPYYVSLAKDLLNDSTVHVDTVVGFPLGMNTIESKEFEAINAIEHGADEIDMVINIGALKDKEFDYVKKEIETVRDSIGGKVLKVIIETCYLTESEIVKMTEICNETYVHFIKTSTGFGKRGVTEKDLKIIKEHKNDILEIKASGGIKTYGDAKKMLDSGATRLGVSHAVEIMEGEKNDTI